MPEFLAKNPNGRIPVVEFDDGTFLAESGGILFYLDEDTPMWPDDPLARARTLQWMLFEQYSHEPSAGARSVLPGTARGPSQAAGPRGCGLAVEEKRRSDRARKAGAMIGGAPPRLGHGAPCRSTRATSSSPSSGSARLVRRSGSRDRAGFALIDGAFRGHE
ncbi:MAG: glutathione S-transferase family protein, partial [Myxococcota bacterium]|nr:glutathione S-transferase family protein [Myxococcota bacterium]